jgi:hypothetical protein
MINTTETDHNTPQQKTEEEWITNNIIITITTNKIINRIIIGIEIIEIMIIETKITVTIVTIVIIIIIIILDL